MNKRELCETNGEVTRVAGGTAPPLIESMLHGRTRVGGVWTHASFEADVHPMQDHVVAAVHSGCGTATVIMDGRRTITRVRPAAISILPRGHGGYWAMDADCRVSHVYLGADRLLGCAELLAEGRTFELLDCVHGADPKMYTIMKVISDEAGSPGPHGVMYLEHAIDLLCVVLLRAHSTLVCPLQRQRGLAPWQVKRVVAYMRERLGAEITLQELASIACLSRFHFCKAFRGATGMAPYEYLTRLRMRAACELLKATSLSIRDVGATVGYSALSTFSTAFRRYAGISPRAYRDTVH